MLRVDDDSRIIKTKQYTWDKIKNKTSKIDPKLCEIIDDLLLEDEYLFTEVLYPFGTDIIKNGAIYFPTDSTNNPTLTDNLKSQTPLILPLQNNCELYLPIKERAVSHAVVEPGEILGFSNILNSSFKNVSATEESPVFPHNLRAGARNIFIIAPITDNAGYEKLKRWLGLTKEKPTNFMQQGDFIAELVQKGDSNWHTSCLFFPNKLVKRLVQKDPEVTELYDYLWGLHRSNYGIWHKKSKLWGSFLEQIQEEMQLHSSYSKALSIANHVLEIAADSAPALIPASGNNSCPTEFIQKNAFIDVYKILEMTGKFPIIMIPAKFKKQNLPVYYSLNHPTLSGYKTEGRNSQSMRSTLDLFLRVIDIYRNWIVRNNVKAIAPSLYSALMHHEFECFHPDPADFKNIKNSSLLPSEDKRFECPIGTFPEHSPFFTGCIKITKKLH